MSPQSPKKLKPSNHDEPQTHPEDDLDIDHEDNVQPEAIAEAPRFSDVSAVSSVFALGSLSRVDRIVHAYSGPRTVHRIEGGVAKPSKKTDDALAKAKFAEAAKAPALSQLPAITNQYLTEIIGWHREHIKLNPAKTSGPVWTKNEDGSFYPSKTLIWGAIDLAIANTDLGNGAKSLKDYIQKMRVPDLTPERLKSLLEWHKEKTGKPPRKDIDTIVWVKEGIDKKSFWSVAPYRWREIENEFRHKDVCIKLGAESLEGFKRLQREERLFGDTAQNHVIPFFNALKR